MKSIDRNPINAAQPRCADAEKTCNRLKASQPRHAASHLEESQRPTAAQPCLADFHSEESQRPTAAQPRLEDSHSEKSQRPTAAQPRHARATSDRQPVRQPRHARVEGGRSQWEELQTQPVRQRRGTRAEDKHAAREEARRATAGQARHTKEARSTHEALRAKQRYCEFMNAVHPSGQFLARLEGEMCHGLQKRRVLSPRRLLLPAAAVLMVFVIMLNLVARQARHAGVPVPVSDLQPSSAATPIESPMANASESQMANASKSQSATPSDSQMANASESQSATPSESQTANASEPQSATPIESQTANASESQSATPSEIQTASASEAEPRRETAMTEEEARARVLEIDMDAATAETIFPFPCAESDGAFVLVRQTMDDATMTTNGRVWYVTPTDAWLLAQKEVIWDWTLNLDSFRPEVFYICHGVDFDRSALAWTVIDGRPVEIQNASSIYGLESTRGALMGYVGFKDYDSVFLGVDTSDPENVLLYQIEGIELTREQFLTFPGAEDVLELVEGDGYFSIYQFLYWQDCAMALNFMKGDLECTTYLYFVDGKLECRGGWFGDDIGLAEGKATPLRDLPIPVRQTHLNANP